MRPKLPNWFLPALIVAGGALAMRAAHLGVFADRSPSPTRHGVVEATAPDGGSTTSTTLALDSRDYAVGDCVMWNQQPGGPETRSTHVVPCDQSHLIEITGRALMPIRTTFPTEAEWQEIIEGGDCGKQVASYLGGEIDPQGRFVAGAITPSEDGWAAGQRDMWCGVQARPLAAHGNSLNVPFTGAAKAQPQGFVLPVGTCLAGDGATYRVDGTVPCTEPHIYEVVGSADASKAFTTPPAADSTAWDTKLQSECTNVARAAFGGRIPAGVTASVDGIDPVSWRIGRRSAECYISRLDAAYHPTTLTAPLLPAH